MSWHPILMGLHLFSARLVQLPLVAEGLLVAGIRVAHHGVQKAPVVLFQASDLNESKVSHLAVGQN